eukprot:7384887-Prymnesium_polylepis.1
MDAGETCPQKAPHAHWDTALERQSIDYAHPHRRRAARAHDPGSVVTPACQATRRARPWLRPRAARSS